MLNFMKTPYCSKN